MAEDPKKLIDQEPPSAAELAREALAPHLEAENRIQQAKQEAQDFCIGVQEEIKTVEARYDIPLTDEEKAEAAELEAKAIAEEKQLQGLLKEAGLLAEDVDLSDLEADVAAATKAEAERSAETKALQGAVDAYVRSYDADFAYANKLAQSGNPEDLSKANRFLAFFVRSNEGRSAAEMLESAVNAKAITKEQANEITKSGKAEAFRSLTLENLRKLRADGQAPEAKPAEELPAQDVDLSEFNHVPTLTGRPPVEQIKLTPLVPQGPEIVVPATSTEVVPQLSPEAEHAQALTSAEKALASAAAELSRASLESKFANLLPENAKAKLAADEAHLKETTGGGQAAFDEILANEVGAETAAKLTATDRAAMFQRYVETLTSGFEISREIVQRMETKASAPDAEAEHADTLARIGEAFGQAEAEMSSDKFRSGIEALNPTEAQALLTTYGQKLEALNSADPSRKADALIDLLVNVVKVKPADLAQLADADYETLSARCAKMLTTAAETTRKRLEQPVVVEPKSTPDVAVPATGPEAASSAEQPEGPRKKVLERLAQEYDRLAAPAAEGPIKQLIATGELSQSILEIRLSDLEGKNGAEHLLQRLDRELVMTLGLKPADIAVLKEADIKEASEKLQTYLKRALEISRDLQSKK